MILLITSVLFLLVFLYVLIKHGKNPSKGGSLAPSKRFWLFYTLYTWFIFLPISLYEGYIGDAFYLSFLLLTVSMWLRAPIEVFMLLKTKNWTPPIGITHDLITLVLFCVPLFSLKSIEFTIESIFAFTLFLSLILETYYAYAFYKIVQDKTKGDEGIWFANKENPEFRRILQITTIFNYPLFLALLMMGYQYLIA